MNRSANVGAALAAAILLTTAACSTEGGSGSGTGGTGISTGGAVGSGGSNGAGGTGNGTGGHAGAGGVSGTGGQITTGAGGVSASGAERPVRVGSGLGVAGRTGTGGLSATGGAAGAAAGSGGVTGSGGLAGGGGQATRARTVQPFDTSWLFHYGDATGASATTFAGHSLADGERPARLEHRRPDPPANPFSQTAATTGRGGYVPSGIAWYRKHFTLPQCRQDSACSSSSTA